jgi:beta-glucosidase
MQDTLRKKWGFDGVVITDYATTHELIAHGVAENDADVGMDIEHPTIVSDDFSRCKGTLYKV